MHLSVCSGLSQGLLLCVISFLLIILCGFQHPLKCNFNARPVFEHNIKGQASMEPFDFPTEIPGTEVLMTRLLILEETNTIIKEIETEWKFINQPNRFTKGCKLAVTRKIFNFENRKRFLNGIWNDLKISMHEATETLVSNLRSRFLCMRHQKPWWAIWVESCLFSINIHGLVAQVIKITLTVCSSSNLHHIYSNDPNNYK